MELTFMKASSGKPLAKRYSQDTVQNYPLVKYFNSRVVDLEALENASWRNIMFLALQQASIQGEALLKGSLVEPLDNQSRKGLTNKEAKNRLIVVDIDGIPLPKYAPPDLLNHKQISREQLVDIAEQIVELLPEVFHNAQYIGHASASMGFKPDIHLHLFFMLDEGILPKQHKELLTLSNFDNRTMKQMTKLTSSGLALSFPVDRSMGDNSRLVYIANPIFSKDQPDPVNTRFFMSKDKDAAEFVLAKDVRRFLKDTGAADTFVKNRIRELRTVDGLPPKTTLMHDMTTKQGKVEQAAINPDRMTLVEVGNDDVFVRYNVNGGDSNAYWVHIADPRIVHNFKDEPPFLFVRADPKAFEAHCIKYGFDHQGLGDNHMHFLFYNRETDNTYGGVIDPHRNKVIEQCRSIARANHRDFMMGADVPEPLPHIHYKFVPTEEREVDLENEFINSFSLSATLRHLDNIPDEYIECTISNANYRLEQLCPTLFKILYSITGDEDGKEELALFVNWLAYICQTRQKTRTAWLFHGTEGTGKGLLYTKILRPLFGHQYVREKTQTDMEDKFNDWLDTTLILALDEFRIGNTRDKKLFAKLKNMVTEDTVSIRAMHKGQQEAKSYVNMIIFSNDRDAVTITQNDRRFNICPRQEKPLFERYPHLNATLDVDAEKELPLLAAFLMHFIYDESHVTANLRNEARTDLQEATQDDLQSFAYAVQHGKLTYLLPVLEESLASLAIDALTGRQLVKEALMSVDIATRKSRQPLRYTKEDLRDIYRLLGNHRETTPTQFGKQLSGHGLRSKRAMRKQKHQFTRDGAVAVFNGYEVWWTLDGRDVDDIQQLQLSLGDDLEYEPPQG